MSKYVTTDRHFCQLHSSRNILLYREIRILLSVCSSVFPMIHEFLLIGKPSGR